MLFPAYYDNDSRKTATKSSQIFLFIQPKVLTREKYFSHSWRKKRKIENLKKMREKERERERELVWVNVIPVLLSQFRLFMRFHMAIFIYVR